MTVRISAVVCTHNRAGYMAGALRSLERQTLSPDRYEVILVDNASTDGTARIAAGFDGLPGFRYLYEPALGLSRARNTGWRHARGEFVAFLDDDAVADPCWLETILHAFETVRPQPGIVGGRIRLIWENPRPTWLGDELTTVLTALDYGDRPRLLTGRELLFGANMAFPRRLIEAAGGFRTDLDRRGSSLLSNGDSDLYRDIVAHGHPGYYHPEAAVGHHAHAARLTQKWFVRRAFWQGVSDAIGTTGRRRLTLPGRCARAVRMLGRVLLSRRGLPGLAPPAADPARFGARCTAVRDLGYAAGLLGMRPAEAVGALLERGGEGG